MHVSLPSRSLHQRLGRPQTCRSVSMAASTSTGKLAAPYNVLITGSSRGVGRALAEEFLNHGDNVVITSRDADKVNEEVEKLRAKYGKERVTGYAADVSKPQEVRALATHAQSTFGTVDLWINNAGSNAYKYGFFVDSDDEDVRNIVETNILGMMYGCKEAIRIMKDQPSGGHVWVMDGAGADGNPTPRFAVYGSTKRGLEQFTKSLRSELNTMGVKNVGVHNLSPGMVTTKLLMSVLLDEARTGANTSPTANFFINCLAEEAHTVAQYLVPLVRKVPETPPTLAIPGQEAAPSGTYIRFLTQQTALKKIFERVFLGKRKNRFVQEN